MGENKNLRIIDFERIIKILKTKKKQYAWAGVITFVLATIWILPQPRYYDCEVELAPEAALKICTPGRTAKATPTASASMLVATASTISSPSGTG